MEVISIHSQLEFYGKGQPTVRKKLQNEFWVGDVGAAHRVVTNSLANSRVRTRHIVYPNTKAKLKPWNSEVYQYSSETKEIIIYHDTWVKDSTDHSREDQQD